MSRGQKALNKVKSRFIVFIALTEYSSMCAISCEHVLAFRAFIRVRVLLVYYCSMCLQTEADKVRGL